MNRASLVRNLAIFGLSFYMLLSYQNCGENPKFNDQLTESSPDLGPVDFIGKISEDADSLWNAPDAPLNKSCKFEVPECAMSEDIAEKCVQDTVTAYYESLECAGFEVHEGDGCLIAISDSKPEVMQPVMLDMTCFNLDEPSKKSLNLGMCYGEEIGFNDDGPSTGMRISAWADLGDEYPYSRQIRQLVFYPNQDSVKLALHQLGGNILVDDACGKSREAFPLNLVIPVEVQKIEK